MEATDRRPSIEDQLTEDNWCQGAPQTITGEGCYGHSDPTACRWCAVDWIRKVYGPIIPENPPAFQAARQLWHQWFGHRTRPTHSVEMMQMMLCDLMNRNDNDSTTYQDFRNAVEALGI